MDRKKIPDAHPKPYKSSLWPHLETIRLLRRQRKTWVAIAAHLEQTNGLKTSFRAVHKFFKRASTGHIPLGFNDGGFTSKTDGSPKSSTDVHVEARVDVFSIETIPDDLFVKTKIKYSKERKA